MGKRKDDPDLAPDASLALEVEDPEARRLEQLAYFGGEDDDIDAYDASSEDDGSIIGDKPAPAASPDDSDDDSGEESEASEEEADDSEEEESEDGEEDTQDDESDTQDGEEESDEDEAEDEADDKSAPKGIPKHRFDEVNERRKAAEARVTELEAKEKAGKQAEEAQYDFRANEKEYMDLLLDGDTEAALSKREEIDAAKEAKWRNEAKTETKTDLKSDAEAQELVSLSVEAEQMFTVFNPDHEDYSQPMLNKVLTFMRGYEADGLSRADAFVAGLADVVEMYDLMPGEEEKPAVKKGPQPTGKKKVDPKKAALAKKSHRPVSSDGKGSADVGAAVPDIDNMTDEEIDALPEKTLARMRGDFV